MGVLRPLGIQRKSNLEGYLVKDLKHLIYFENLLQATNNELVQQAKKEGTRAIGYTRN